MKRIIALALCLVVAISLLTGCNPLGDTFTYEDVTISLTDGFYDQSSAAAKNDFDFGVSNAQITILGYKDNLFGDTPMEYAREMMEISPEASGLANRGKYIYFHYIAQSLAMDVGIFEDGSRVWVIQISCNKGRYESLKGEMRTIMDSVKIS